VHRGEDLPCWWLHVLRDHLAFELVTAAQMPK
jgi:hypothetical protein